MYKRKCSKYPFKQLNKKQGALLYESVKKACPGIVEIRTEDGRIVKLPGPPGPPLKDNENICNLDSPKNEFKTDNDMKKYINTINECVDKRRTFTNTCINVGTPEGRAADDRHAAHERKLEGYRDLCEENRKELEEEEYVKKLRRYWHMEENINHINTLFELPELGDGLKNNLKNLGLSGTITHLDYLGYKRRKNGEKIVGNRLAKSSAVLSEKYAKETKSNDMPSLIEEKRKSKVLNMAKIINSPSNKHLIMSVAEARAKKKKAIAQERANKVSNRAKIINSGVPQQLLHKSVIEEDAKETKDVDFKKAIAQERANQVSNKKKTPIKGGRKSKKSKRRKKRRKTKKSKRRKKRRKTKKRKSRRKRRTKRR